MYQMTRLSRDRGALVNDDRLDALSMAVAYHSEAMAQDAEVRMGQRREEALQGELVRMQRQHQMGFAVITGHNLKDSQKSYRW